MNLELCTDCVEGAAMAGKYGFKRIELCSALSEGGLTPSFGLIQACAEASGITEVHAMIRTRGGSFTCRDGWKGEREDPDLFLLVVQWSLGSGSLGTITTGAGNRPLIGRAPDGGAPY